MLFGRYEESKLKRKEKVMKKLTKREIKRKAKLEEKEKGQTLTEQLERAKAEDWKILCRKLNLKIN